MKINKNAFTLTEVLIAIVVTTIFFGLVSTILGYTIRSWRNNNILINAQNEYEQLAKIFDNYVNNSNNNSTTISFQSSDNQQFLFSDTGNNLINLTINESNISLSVGSNSFIFKYINRVEFNINDNSIVLKAYNYNNKLVINHIYPVINKIIYESE